MLTLAMLTTSLFQRYVVMSFFLIAVITIENVVAASIFGVRNSIADPSLNPKQQFWWSSKMQLDVYDRTPEETIALSGRGGTLHDTRDDSTQTQTQLKLKLKLKLNLNSNSTQTQLNSTCPITRRSAIR